MDDIAARLAITVETGNSLRDLDNLREKINAVTAAREKDLQVSAAAVSQMKELVNAQKQLNASSRIIGQAYPQNVISRSKATSETQAVTRLSKEAIKEEIAASTRALQKQREELSAVNKIIEERGTKSVEELKIEQAAAKQVLVEQKLDAVLDTNAVFIGGVDITDLVIQKLKTMP